LPHVTQNSYYWRIGWFNILHRALGKILACSIRLALTNKTSPHFDTWRKANAITTPVNQGLGERGQSEVFQPARGERSVAARGNLYFQNLKSTANYLSRRPQEHWIMVMCTSYDIVYHGACSNLYIKSTAFLERQEGGVKSLFTLLKRLEGLEKDVVF
jgi:hypothetical protein